MAKATVTKSAKTKTGTKKPVRKSASAAKSNGHSVAAGSGKKPAVTASKPRQSGTPTGTKAQKSGATGKASQIVSKASNSRARVPVQVAVAKSPARTPARTMAVSKPAATKKSEGASNKMAARTKIADIALPPDYRPAEGEPFMNDMHRAYFRKRLLDWKDEIQRQTRETLAILHEDSTQHADLADRATSETDRATELRTRDRQRKLIAKIDAAIARIEDGSYGYCEDTGEPIGLKRLDARPIATLSVEAQERHERRERVYREE
jgi:DnaK suppressor protein